MPKKTVRKSPKNPKTSSHQPSGLIAKGLQAKESARENCALDNRSHRTFRGRRAYARHVLRSGRKAAQAATALIDEGVRTRKRPFRWH